MNSPLRQTPAADSSDNSPPFPSDEDADTGLAEAPSPAPGILHVSTHLQYCFPASPALSPSCPTCLLFSFPNRG